jgi:hypothetical protein
MWVRSRKLSVFTAASYLLVISLSALFHDHHGHNKGPSRPGVSAAHAADDHDCSVCQFLAQKPAPAAEIAPEIASALVQDIAAPAPLCLVRGVFAAWQSRAPPSIT